MYKSLSVPIALLFLAGCTTTTYIPPEPVMAPTLGQPVSMMTTEQTIPVPFNQAWNNIQAYSKERYRTLRQNKAAGEMTLFVDAFEPSSSINCGMMDTQSGMFNTRREFLSEVSREAPVNLNVTVQVKLTAKSAKQTFVSVNTEYDLAVGYRTNPGTGAIEGGAQYRFDSKGVALVSAPGSGFEANCRPTGVVESGILGAAQGQ
jgi:hypothetical protein